MTGIMMVRAALTERGDPRKKFYSGLRPRDEPCIGGDMRLHRRDGSVKPEGGTDLEALRRMMNKDVAALMLTNPNTLGKFEQNIEEVCRIVHDGGGFVYMDGANINALVGWPGPRDFGIDVMHLNLHKTFSTPHGGGGTRRGPGRGTRDARTLSSLSSRRPSDDGQLTLDFDRPKSVGRVRAYFGNFGVLVRALSYVLTHGDKGSKKLRKRPCSTRTISRTI